MKAIWPRFPSKANWPEYYRRNSCVFNGWVLHVTKMENGYVAQMWKEGPVAGTDRRKLGVFDTNAEAKAALEKAALAA